MTKTIQSPVPHFAGEVDIPDFLTFPQAIAWEKALDAANDLLTDAVDNDGHKILGEDGRPLRINKPGVTNAEYYAAWLPGIKAVVQEWRLKNLGPDNEIPRTPNQSSERLIGWLIDEITKLYKEEAVPND